MLRPARPKSGQATASALRRFALTCAVIAAGWAFATLFRLDNYYQSRLYSLSATALLTVGLFASTHAIEIREVRHNARLIVTAVTVGVLAKAALIIGTMYFLLQ